MYTDNFVYLEDGQLAPQISEWQTRLRTSRAEWLSVLFDRVKALSCASFEAEVGRMEATERDLILALSEATAHLARSVPLPKSFFVTAEEKNAAIQAVWSFFLSADSWSREWNALFTDLYQYAKAVQEKRNGEYAVVCEIVCAKRAAKESGDGSSEEEIKRIEGFFESIRDQNAQMLQRLERLLESARHITSELKEPFLNRLSRVADTAHDGASCNSEAVIRIAGELAVLLGQEVKTDIS